MKSSTSILPFAKNIRAKQTHAGKWYVASIFYLEAIRSKSKSTIDASKRREVNNVICKHFPFSSKQ